MVSTAQTLTLLILPAQVSEDSLYLIEIAFSSFKVMTYSIVLFKHFIQKQDNYCVFLFLSQNTDRSNVLVSIKIKSWMRGKHSPEFLFLNCDISHIYQFSGALSHHGTQTANNSACFLNVIQNFIIQHLPQPPPNAVYQFSMLPSLHRQKAEDFFSSSSAVPSLKANMPM